MYVQYTVCMYSSNEFQVFWVAFRKLAIKNKTIFQKNKHFLKLIIIIFITNTANRIKKLNDQVKKKKKKTNLF